MLLVLVVQVLTYFNPRSPRGGATTVPKLSIAATIISIHAPHEGERLVFIAMAILRKLFQSTLPTRGSDVVILMLFCILSKFQSTLPTRGSDYWIIIFYNYFILFQSTLPTRGSDADAVQIFARQANYFNPRSPRGGATWEGIIYQRIFSISIHAPHEGERLGQESL